MKKLKKPSARHIRSVNRFSKTNLTVFTLIFAAIGGYLIYSSFAAGFTSSFEAENASKNSPATTVADTGASGGNALKFAKAGSCSGTSGQPDGADPWGGCWPGPLTTGVPTGTTLTNVPGQATSGSGWTWDSASKLVNVTTNNVTVSSLNITGELLISASGVTVKNSKINGDVRVFDDTTNSVLLTDVEINCGGSGTGVGEAFYTVRRANIHGCENGFDMNQSIDVRDSYIHGLPIVGHDDGFQMALGHFENHQVVSGVRNLNIVHNTVYGHNEDFSATKSQESDFGTSAIISNTDSATNILIQYNLFAGGGYTVYCSDRGISNYKLLDNRFSNIFTQSIGFYGPTASCSTAGLTTKGPGETTTGNVYNEDGCFPHNSIPCTPYKAGDPLPLD
jgi:hypothetical protein